MKILIFVKTRTGHQYVDHLLQISCTLQKLIRELTL